MTFSQCAVEAAIQATDKLDHRKATSMADLTRQIAEAALTAALAVDGVALVPQSALDWLFGEAPNAEGKWFGETIGEGLPKMAGRYPRTYWWRSEFRTMLAAASDGEERR